MSGIIGKQQAPEVVRERLNEDVKKQGENFGFTTLHRTGQSVKVLENHNSYLHMQNLSLTHSIYSLVYLVATLC